MKNIMDYKYLLGGAAVVFFLGVLVSSFGATTLGGAPAGVPGYVATSSSRTWTVASELAFATSSCSSRIVGTRGDAIRVTFSDRIGETPSASVGFPQAASTTVVYDASLYGCGAMKIFSYTAQVINLAETQ